MIRKILDGEFMMPLMSWWQWI